MAVLGADLPQGSGVLLAIVLGVAAGGFADLASAPRRRRPREPLPDHPRCGCHHLRHPCFAHRRRRPGHAPDQVERALKYVAPAAFAAIGAPALLGGDQFAAFGDDLPRIIAVVLAGVVITKTRSVPLSLFAGMSALWLILWVS